MPIPRGVAYGRDNISSSLRIMDMLWTAWRRRATNVRHLVTYLQARKDRRGYLTWQRVAAFGWQHRAAAASRQHGAYLIALASSASPAWRQ